MSNVLFWFSHVGLASLDMIVLGLMGLGALLYGIAVGRDRAILVLLSIYVALAVVTNAPVVSSMGQRIGSGQYPSLHLVWFIVVFFFIFIVLWRSRLMRGLTQSRGCWWEAALFSLLQTGLAVSIALFLLPSEVGIGLSPLFQQVFLSDIGRSFWMIAPMAALALIGGEGTTFDLF